jgi:hypothetical protein
MSTTIQNHADRGHAEFSPSAIKYFAACRGWQSRGGTSDAAEVGTRIHEAVEVRNPSALRDERELSIYEQLVEAEERWLATIFPEHDALILREEAVDITLPYECDTFGTSDLVAISGSVALVLDYKTGIGEIDDVEKNWQSKAYSIGVFQKYPEVETIHAVFLIPQRNEELHGIYTREMLPQMEDQLARAIVLAKTVRPKWHIGTPAIEELSPNNGCQYCAFASRCPALDNLAVEVASRYEPELMPEGAIRSTEVDDPETLGRLYVIASIVEKWAEGIKRKSVLSALDGLSPVGFKLRSMGSTRKITDVLGFIQTAEEKLSLDKSELMQFAEFPFAKIRDYFSGKAKRGEKTAYAKLFEETLTEANVIEAGTERFTLVKDS